MTIRIWLLVTLLLIPLAGQAQEKGKVKRDRNRISPEEIATTKAASVLDAVRRLRPNWFTNRGVSGLGGDNPQTRETGMQVYVDGMRRGDIQELRGIPLEQVAEIRYLPAEEAVVRYGSDLPFGAIEVTTKKGG